MRNGNKVMIAGFKKLIGCRRGVTAIEYGLILALICVMVIAAISLLGGKTLTMWKNVSEKVPAVAA